MSRYQEEALEASAENLADSFNGVIKQLSEDLKRSDINFVIGRLSDFDMDNKKYPHWTKIRDVQVQIASEDPHGEWVDTDDLNNKQGKDGQLRDDLHYTQEGYKILGQRFAEKAISLIRRNQLPIATELNRP